jgi:AcrR family transcriptional regulator
VLHDDPPHGYARTSVAAVVERAGVSSKVFYEHVAGKARCSLAAYDAGVEVLRCELGVVLDAPVPPGERVGRAIGPRAPVHDLVADRLGLVGHVPVPAAGA